MTEVEKENVRVNGGWVDQNVLRCMLCLSSIDQVSKINIHASLDAIVATRPKNADEGSQVRVVDARSQSDLSKPH